MSRPTYGKLARVGNRWVLTDVRPHVALRMKSMFPRIQKTVTGTFTFPASPESCADLDWFLQRYPMDMENDDVVLLSSGRDLFEQERIEAEAILLPGYAPAPVVGFKPPYALYHEQSQARDLLIRRKSLLLGDDVGLGKTLVALGTCVGSSYLPAAIVVQAHLATQWAEKYVKKFTHLVVHIVQGRTPYQLPPANLYIFKYSNLQGWADDFATGFFRAVFFDEVQELRKGTATEKGKAAKVLADNAVIRCGMSATPVFNYGDEMFNIVEFLEPGLLGTYEEFLREWCVYVGSGNYKVKDPEALGHYLREVGLLLRRVRQGRRINVSIVEVDHDEEISASSAERARMLAIKTTSGSFTERGQASRELDAWARHNTGVAKAKSVAAYARMLLAQGEPIMLAGWHRDVYAIWLEELADFKPVLYTGSETVKQKDRAKDDFVSGKTNCFIISLRSGSGLDGLQTRCKTVIVGELDWSGAIYDQLFGRVDRPGQEAKEITAIFTISNDGSDPVVMSVNGVKKYQQQGIMDPGMGIIPVQTDESHIKLLAKSYLEGAGA